MTGHRQLPSEADEISQQVYGIIQEQLESMPNELDGDNEIMQIAVTPLQVSGTYLVHFLHTRIFIFLYGFWSQVINANHGIVLILKEHLHIIS